MTKKDYELIAGVLANTGIRHALKPRSKEREQWNMDVLGIAYALRADNPRFDSARFLKACGV